MPGLLDIAASTQTVPVGVPPTNLAVYGVSAEGIAVLLQRFPVIREVFTGKTPDFTAEMIVKLVPQAISCIIACGCGQPGNKEAEDAASKLSASDQADLLEKILELTMPKGAGPFVEKLMRLVEIMGVESTNIPDMKSPLPSKP